MRRITEERYIPKDEENYIKKIKAKLAELSKKAGIMIFGEYLCLLIAVNEYIDPEIRNLKKPQKDAEDLKNVWERKYGFCTETVVIPTRKKIIDALAGLREKISDQDNLIIFFSGHGEWIKEQKQGYLLPCDAEKNSYANWISHAEIKAHLRPLQAKNILLIFDSCFSGTISRKIESGYKRCEEKHKIPSKKALTSCAEQVTPDESLFFKHLTAILSENTEILAMSSLFDPLEKAVIETEGDVPRMPQLISIYGDHQEGDFIFVPVSKMK